MIVIKCGIVVIVVVKHGGNVIMVVVKCRIIVVHKSA